MFISDGLIFRYSMQIRPGFGIKNTEFYADSKNMFKNLTFCFSWYFPGFLTFTFFKFSNGFENKNNSA